MISVVANKLSVATVLTGATGGLSIRAYATMARECLDYKYPEFVRTV